MSLQFKMSTPCHVITNQNTTPCHASYANQNDRTMSYVSGNQNDDTMPFHYESKCQHHAMRHTNQNDSTCLVSLKTQ